MSRFTSIRTHIRVNSVHASDDTWPPSREWNSRTGPCLPDKVPRTCERGSEDEQYYNLELMFSSSNYVGGVHEMHAALRWTESTGCLQLLSAVVSDTLCT